MAEKTSLPVLWRLRNRIDRVDRGIMRLLLKRSSLVERIGRLKKQQGIPVEDGERERQILSRIDLRKSTGAQRDFVRKVYKHIFSVSREMERGKEAQIDGITDGSDNQGKEIDTG